MLGKIQLVAKEYMPNSRYTFFLGGQDVLLSTATPREAKGNCRQGGNKRDAALTSSIPNTPKCLGAEFEALR